MFAPLTSDKTKIVAEGKLKRTSTTPGGIDASQNSPLWQSLAPRAIAIQPKLVVSRPAILANRRPTMSRIASVTRRRERRLTAFSLTPTPANAGLAE